MMRVADARQRARLIARMHADRTENLARTLISR